MTTRFGYCERSTVWRFTVVGIDPYLTLHCDPFDDAGCRSMREQCRGQDALNVQQLAAGSSAVYTAPISALLTDRSLLTFYIGSDRLITESGLEYTVCGRIRN